jgi:hypothetical protein
MSTDMSSTISSRDDEGARGHRARGHMRGPEAQRLVDQTKAD